MTSTNWTKIIGVDVGGTFTDLVALDTATDAVKLAKVPSTPENQAVGVLDAVRNAGAKLQDVGLVVHGTTTTTNAVLERKLSRTGLITTKGFRDVLELGRRTRPQPYGMTGVFTPLIPRNRRLEVSERMDADGQIVVPLDEEEVESAASKLLDDGCESVVIHFLHAYANPTHERRAAEIVGRRWPNDYITTGHSLLSESREFERGVTAAVNASVQPLLERYVNRLKGDLKAGGYRGSLLVMNGNGGMVSADHVSKEAAKTVMSGPASGVMAAAYSGQRVGIPNLITYDMGGTSTDVALIKGGHPTVSSEIELEYAMPIHVPLVDVRTVGAGGGSIAKVNAAGLLEVGPESAGAVPGPICYGRGGTEPTISDANLLLGRLDVSKLSSLDGGVDMENVAARFSADLGASLGLDATQSAAAVIRMANTKMAGAIRMVSISLGADPRDFALFAFGGAGPLHASALARELGIPKILIPRRPGITNALGCIVADLRHDYVRTVNRPLDTLDMSELHAIFERQSTDGVDFLNQQGIDITSIKHLHSVDMQFVGQTHLLRVELETGRPERETLQRLFEQTYFDRFRVKLDEILPNLVNVNTSVVGHRSEFDLSNLVDRDSLAPTIEEARTATRQVFFDGNWLETPVYWREHLPLEFRITGPAIIEQMDTTLLVEPGDRAEGIDHGNILVHVGGA